ncbi:MAG: TonB-dependent receptor [Alphaproteobacteria bacterium]|nr:MAG: TonB-dependent receptor [Alphaproteobacteria bacterium]
MQTSVVIAILLAANCLLAPSSAQASVQIKSYEIPAGPLDTALYTFAEEAKLSISFSGLDLAKAQSVGTSGQISKEASLRSILKDTGFSFRFITSSSVQIFVRERNTTDDTVEKPDIAELEVDQERPEYVEDLVVTATKRPETSFGLPVSVSAVSSLALEDLGTYDLQSLAAHLAGVSTTNLGPGRNKIFIRGLSDGPYADRTTSMVGVYLDEAPINFSDTNPDIRLYDVERIELMRGPQGTLYGAGSLGGLYRVISAKPVLNDTFGKTRIGVGVTKGGGHNGNIDVIFNTPLKTDQLGFRISAYGHMRGGYIDDVARGLENLNDLDIYGMRPSVRWQINNAWVLDTSINLQAIRYDDSQYYFEEQGRNKRSLQLSEPYGDNFVHGVVTLKGRMGSVQLTSATSFVDRTLHETFDASEGLPFAERLKNLSEDEYVSSNLIDIGDGEDFLGDAQPGTLGYFTREDINTLGHETRLQSSDSSRFEWLAGVYYLHSTSNSDRLMLVATESGAPGIVLAEKQIERAEDIALFGEASYRVSSKFSVTAGIRYAYNTLALDYVSDFALAEERQAHEKQKATTKLIPKIAARYQWSDDIQTYAQIGMGYREGGFNILSPFEALARPEAGSRQSEDFEPRELRSDEIINYEVGLKSYWLNRDLSLNLAAFYVRWLNIQSDQLGYSGLPYVTNVGNARNLGFEIEFSARPIHGLEVSGSLFWNDSELQDGNPSLGAEPGDRLPAIPEPTFSLAALYQFDVNRHWLATLSATYSFTGDSVLTFDEENSLGMGDYSIVNAHFEFSDSSWKLGLYVENLTDSRANTFSYGNPFTVSRNNQVTPPRPRTIGVYLERKF